MYFAGNIARVCKVFQRCGLTVQRSSGLCCKRATGFHGHISRNYCISATNNRISTLKDPDPDSADAENCSVASLVDKIKSNITLKHGLRYEHQFHDVNSVVDHLLKFKDVKQDRLLSLFVKQPSLCQHYFRSWEKSLDALHGNGIPVSQILNILEDCPQILKRDPVAIDNVFVCLREHNFHDKRLLKLLCQTPELLLIDAHTISQQIASLMTLFTKKDVLKLAITSPQVLLEDFEDVEDKVRYIVHEIGVEQTFIVSNAALSHSLQHIQLRHEVMLRTGMYRKPHPKKKILNPSLSDMLATSNKTFTEDICKISLDEYVVFGRMLQREIEKRKAMEESSDSESDSEDDEEEKN